MKKNIIWVLPLDVKVLVKLITVEFTLSIVGVLGKMDSVVEPEKQQELMN